MDSTILIAVLIILIVFCMIYKGRRPVIEKSKFSICAHGVSETGYCLPCAQGEALIFSGYGLVCGKADSDDFVYPDSGVKTAK